MNINGKSIYCTRERFGSLSSKGARPMVGPFGPLEVTGLLTQLSDSSGDTFLTMSECGMHSTGFKANQTGWF